MSYVYKEAPVLPNASDESSFPRPPSEGTTPTATGTQSVVDPAEAFLDRSTAYTKVRRTLHRYPMISAAIVLGLAVIAFSMFNARFASVENLSLILQQVAVLGLLAAGQTLIVLTAGIDLSVGVVMIASGLIAAKVAVDSGASGLVALAVMALVGLGAGAVNGVLVARFKLPPFIVTLGTLNAFLALGLLLSGGKSISGSDLPSLLTWTGQPLTIGSLRTTTGVLIMLAVYLVLSYSLARTAWGRHVYAVGDDSAAARLAGVSVSRVLLSAYVVAGFVYALASWVQIGRSNAAAPNVSPDLNLDSITAVVIGGTSLFGGRGLIWGSLMGAVIVGVFRNGLSLAGVNVLYQTLAVGILIIVAVSVDQWIRKAPA
jgi:fructose transport system permease protein